MAEVDDIMWSFVYKVVSYSDHLGISNCFESQMDFTGHQSQYGTVTMEMYIFICDIPAEFLDCLVQDFNVQLFLTKAKNCTCCYANSFNYTVIASAQF